MSDSEAWLELCDIYLQEHEYDKAAFCMEELLLCKPYNHLIHQKYAEVSDYLSYVATDASFLIFLSVDRTIVSSQCTRKASDLTHLSHNCFDYCFPRSPGLAGGPHGRKMI